MNTLEILAELKHYKVVPRLDGDHLKLTGETKNLSPEIIGHVKDRKEELIAFLKNSMDQFNFAPIPLIPSQAYYPTTNAQKRLWVLCQFEGGVAAYNIVTSFYLKGIVDKEHLNRAFQYAVGRHESLRTVFTEINGIPYQVVLDHMPFDIEFEDISQLTDIKGFLQSETAQSAYWQFDLERGPLLRVKLFRLSDDEHAMIFGLHHIVSDGWSISVMVREVMGFYKALCTKEQLVAEPLAIQYKDYADWLSQKIEGAKGSEAKEFWQKEFASVDDALDLPADFPRPAMKSFDGTISKFYFDHQLYTDIQSFCRKHQVTLFNFFRATVSILLYKLSGQKDITIGTPVSGRNHFDLENQVGLYVNTLPLKTSLIPEELFISFLKQVSEHSFRVFEFQDYPLDRIIEDLQIKRDISRNPLFDVMMVLQNTAMGDGTINMSKHHGFNLSILDHYLAASGHKSVAAKFDLNLNFDTEPDNKFFLEIEYSTKLFKQERINRFFASYMQVITQVLDTPGMPLHSIEIISQEEKQQILHTFNAPVKEITAYSITSLFDFEKYENKPAIITASATVSYAELQAAVDQVAAHLFPIITKGAFVGLLLGRSEWMIISVLGVLKAGAGYVPVDIKYPTGRINYIIEDAQPAIILVDDAGISLVPENYTGRVIHINGLKATTKTIIIKERDRREQAAYLIYTSGSTGLPKGVKILHRNTIAFLQWSLQEFANTDFEILYASTSYCFDLSVFEFFLPLLKGKTIRLLQSALEISQFINTDKKVLINTVPSVVRTLLDGGMNWSEVTALNMAGEPVPESMKSQLDFSGMEVRNLYGPSEDTTYSTVYRFEDDGLLSVPIGVPVGYTQLYILDEYQHLLPVGMNGEICLSGQSVAAGYLNKEALTAEKFVANPFLPGQTMYKTGDIGRWLPDGKVEFAGRIDEQVKIRGYRIEPGEIRYLLEQHPLVQQAVVIVKTIAAEKQLVAYWTGEATAPQLKEYLTDIVPAYMVPAYWLALAMIPLNANGKIDKAALPDPVITVNNTPVIPPHTNTEQQLLELWKSVLQVEELGIVHNFFDLGGHSLKATALRSQVAGKLRKELTLDEIFTHPTIAQQAAIIDAKRTISSVSPIPKTTEQPWYPISFAQERLWVLTGFEDASLAYNMPAVFRIKGKLDVPRLEEAFREVIKRHEILRTVFMEKNGKPVQIVLKNMPFSIEEINVSLEPAAELQFLQNKWQTPFNLEKGPLLHCFILNGHLLSFNMHHIISDGWSVGVLFNEVTAYYRSGHKKAMPALQYRDFAIWQREQLSNEAETFWKEMFNGDIPVLDLPTDFYRPDVKTYHGDTFNCPLPLTGLKQLARQSGVSLFMTLMAGVAVLLKKYANQNDIVIGTPVAGREQLQLQDQIGFYVNTLALRTKIDGEISFQSFLMKERASILKAFEYQSFPFEKLTEDLQLKRNLSRSPLFDVMVVLQNTGDMKYISPDLELERIITSAGIAKYDLTFSFAEETESLELEYNTDLFKKETIQQMATHLSGIFEQITTTPEILIKDISLPGKSFARADQTHVRYDTEATIISLFQQAVHNYPSQTALIVGDTAITYEELDKRSSQLAYILIKEFHVQAEDLVVLHFNRNEWMLIAILGVLKAGAAYVPVDPAYPAARINYIIEDSNSRLILSDTTTDNAVNITELNYTGPLAVADIRPQHLAYVIYTSGTTGNPKGVMIEHRNVTRLLFNDNNLFDFDATDRWSLFHSYCFDFSVWEMYGALLNGGTLVMVPKETAQDSAGFYDFLHREQITVLNQTPTAFRSLVLHNKLDRALAVRYLIFGGEALMPEILKDWQGAFPGCKNINMYGITETTVHVTYKEIDPQEGRSNIGVCIPTLSCYVLDMDLKQVPVGTVGELCVGGAGVARGYLNRQELTAEKFIDNPERSGELLYRSGDYARILPSGDIEYIGRRDEQVKIRGHRIETAEVEAAITRLAGIKDAVVLPLKTAGNEYELVAYFIPQEETNNTDLRKKLSETLPAYMVPAYLIPLPAFPFNQNGKLDKHALPKPEESRQTTYVACRNDIDKQVVAIWEAILERDGIGIKDNFFDLGGHSLKATRVISKIHEVFGIKIDLKNLFMDPTVEHLTNYIETIQWMDNKQEVLAGGEDELIF